MTTELCFGQSSHDEAQQQRLAPGFYVGACGYNLWTAPCCQEIILSPVVIMDLLHIITGQLTDHQATNNLAGDMGLVSMLVLVAISF